MKKIIFAALIAAIAFQSCDITNKGIDPQTAPVEKEGNWGNVSFTISAQNDPVATRSITQSEESKVNSLQILVYNSSNVLVAYGSAEANHLSLSVPIGVAGHKVYAAVNFPSDLSSNATPVALEAAVSYLKDNSSAGLMMIGSASDQTFTSGNAVPVEVTRFASRVEIDNITCSFSSAALRAQEFKIDGIYLINVKGSDNLKMDGTASSWFNQLKYVSGDCNSQITEMFSSSDTLQTAAGTVTPHSTKHYFYCYQNPTSTDTHGGTDFSARRTRLVVETTLGAKKYYYPIDIVDSQGKLPANNTFTITSLTITGPGVDNPDDELNKGNINFTLTIKNWVTGFSKEVQY